MIFTLLLFFQFSAHASELDLSDVRSLSELDTQKPSFIESRGKERIIRENKNKYPPYYEVVGFEQILESPEELGALRKGTPIYTFDGSKKKILEKDIFIRFHRQPDDQGFKYLVSKNGEINFKVETNHIRSIAPETVMYEPPHTYTPAPEIKRIHWDEKLSKTYELGFATSFVSAGYLQDLLNVESAPTGQMNHFGGNVMANWDWPVKVGLGAYYQRGSFSTDIGTTTISSFSMGPVFKSKNFYPYEQAMRFVGQVRYSPFGKMNVEVTNGSTSFDFNTTDLLLGVEFPFENKWGEFVVSLFSHTQWFSMKNQEEIVNIESSNKPNQAIGLGIAQVF